jgi:hypothetical protein
MLSIRPWIALLIFLCDLVEAFQDGLVNIFCLKVTLSVCCTWFNIWNSTYVYQTAYPLGTGIVVLSLAKTICRQFCFLLSFFFSPFYCLISFELRLLIAPLLSSNFSYIVSMYLELLQNILRTITIEEILILVTNKLDQIVLKVWEYSLFHLRFKNIKIFEVSILRKVSWTSVHIYVDYRWIGQRLCTA